MFNIVTNSDTLGPQVKLTFKKNKSLPIAYCYYQNHGGRGKAPQATISKSDKRSRRKRNVGIHNPKNHFFIFRNIGGKNWENSSTMPKHLDLPRTRGGTYVKKHDPTGAAQMGRELSCRFLLLWWFSYASKHVNIILFNSRNRWCTI